MSSSWIFKLNESNGRLHKEEVLRQALTASILGSENATIFLKGLRWCYNPYITFGIRQIPDTIGITNQENPWTALFNLFTDLNDRVLSGHAARDAVDAMSERFDSDEWNNFVAPILRRDMRSGITATTINKIVEGNLSFEIPVFKCQLAVDNVGRPEMRGIKRLEPKLDGTRMLVFVTFPEFGGIKVNCYSRAGKEFENFSHIANQIEDHAFAFRTLSGSPRGVVLDGEAISQDFQKLMRQLNRKTNVQNDDAVFHIFDIIPISNFLEGHFNAPFSKRINLLNKLAPTIDKMPNVELLDHVIVDLDTPGGQAEFHQYCAERVAAGFEGVMIKSLDAPYECSRNTFWMKYKPTITVDLQIVGFQEGTGKNQGRLGALVCAGEHDGTEIAVNVGSGFDDRFRAQVWADVIGSPIEWTKIVKKKTETFTAYPTGRSCVGDTVEIMADAVTQNQDGTYSLRFPRFLRFRDDKD